MEHAGPGVGYADKSQPKQDRQTCGQCVDQQVTGACGLGVEGSCSQYRPIKPFSSVAWSSSPAIKARELAPMVCVKAANRSWNAINVGDVCVVATAARLKDFG
jgi:hypothetical protein